MRTACTNFDMLAYYIDQGEIANSPWPAQRDLFTHPPYRPGTRYMLFDLPRDVIRSVARFRLRVHVSTPFALKQQPKIIPPLPLLATCVRLMWCMSRMKNEKHVLFHCTHPQMVSFRRKYACLFSQIVGCFFTPGKQQTPPFYSWTYVNRGAVILLDWRPFFCNLVILAKSAEHASRPFLASAYRIRRFVCEHALADRPHTSLWLAKTYVIPAGMYGSQVWGTGFLQAGREFSSSLSMLHLYFLQGTLGVNRSTTNWAVLRARMWTWTVAILLVLVSFQAFH